MSLCKKANNKDRVERFGGVVTVQLLIKIGMIFQHHLGFLHNVLGLRFCEKAHTECECSRTDAVMPVTEPLVGLLNC